MPSNNQSNYIFIRAGFIHTNKGGEGVNSAGLDHINAPALAILRKAEPLHHWYTVLVPPLSKIAEPKVVLCGHFQTKSFSLWVPAPILSNLSETFQGHQSLLCFQSFSHSTSSPFPDTKPNFPTPNVS